MSLHLETAAVCSLNLRSLPQRFWMSFSTVVAIALVVTVLLAFLAMGTGFRKTLSGTGAEDIALILRKGSTGELSSVVTRDEQRVLDEAPGIAKVDGKPLASPELYVIVDAIKKSSGTKANMPLRGIGPNGLALRANASIIEGRLFKPGSNEIVVGRGLLKEFSGFELGKAVRFGVNTWKVVGVFEADGSAFESELWADLPVIQSLFKRGNTAQTVRARLTSPAALKTLQDYIKSDPRLNVEAQSEKQFYAEQSKRLSSVIQSLGWPLGIAMALGALSGALNTMYSSVSARAGEIRTLRIIGFGSISTFVGTMVEAMVLTALGALLGIAITWLFFDGLTASTIGGSFSQVVFDFRLSGANIINGFVLAMVVGFLGGLFPAWRAARQKISAIDA